jgi:hypothetical protein
MRMDLALLPRDTTILLGYHLLGYLIRSDSMSKVYYTVW